jgi:acyl transferase domain-containing protein/acyl carrier protein
MKEFTKLIFEQVANKKLDSKTAKTIINSYQSQIKRPDSEETSREIAVIGMACNFGKATNLREFWNNMEQEKDCLTEVPKDRWGEEHRYSENPADTLKSYSKWGSFVSHAKDFDAEFFNQSEYSAYVTDPQQRLFLHLCWEALENAGYGSSDSRNCDMGVFVGARGNVYDSEGFIEDINTSSMSRKERIELFRSVLLGKAPNMIAAAVSNFLNLKGPSLAVDTACSSSLVSIHLACQSILNGDCDMAIAGGIEILADPNTYVYLSQIKALSPEGKCKTFDKNANGYVPGEGGGAVILKPLAKALKDKDNIMAIIKGSAVNNDGYTVGTTTPDVEGQKTVLKKAYKTAGIAPESITLIEAHGTGTFLGDPTEFRALTEVFSENTRSSNFCAIGTVKSNIGHLHSAAGIASFIKVVLALRKKKIPATLNCKEPNPRFDLITSPFYIADHTAEWITNGINRRAGISSFGFGGTNCHIILEEAESMPIAESSSYANAHLAVYSAKDKEALRDILIKHLEFLEEYTGGAEEYTYSLNTGREKFDYCITITFSELKELKQKLAVKIQDLNLLSGIKQKESDNNELPKVVMIFPGQGSQYKGMAGELYHCSVSFREAFDQCDEIIRQHLGQSIKSMIHDKDADNWIHETRFTQPIVFAMDYSIGRMWMDLGIMPSAVLGHSIGEYAAACIAGVFQLEDAIKLVVKRAALMNAVDCNGGMMVVSADESTVEKVSDKAFHGTDKEIYIAAANGFSNTVISGTKEALLLIKQEFSEAGISVKELAVSHPFHSELMEPMLEEYKYVLSTVKMASAQIPLVCNVTGDFKYNFDADYWLSHIIKPVKFHQSVSNLVKKEYDCYLEAGSGTTIASMLKRIEEVSHRTCISTIKPYESNWKSLLEAVAILEELGVSIRLKGLYKTNGRQKIELPSYPFRYSSYWINQDRTVETDSKVKVLTENVKNQGNLGYALLDTIKYVLDEEIELEKTVKPDDLEVIRNHIVEEDVVMPGVCFWEMAQIAALHGYGKVPVMLSTITYPSPLVIHKETETTYRLHLDKQSGKFKVSYLLKEDTEPRWAIAAMGTIDAGAGTEKKALDILSVKQRLSINFSEGSVLKKQFLEKGLNYGKKFYSVAKIWEGKNEALTELKFDIDAETERYMYFPGILDGALQTIAGVEEVVKDSRKYIPYRVKKIEYYGLLQGTSYGYVKLLRYNEENGLIEFQVTITDIHGDVKIYIENMCLKAVKEKTKEKEKNSNRVIDEYYSPYWQEVKVSVNVKEKRRRILLFKEDSKESILSAIIKKSHGVTEVYNCGVDYIADERGFTVNPHRQNSYENLFRDLKKQDTVIDNIILDYTMKEPVNNYIQAEESLRNSVMELVYLINSLRIYYLDDIHIIVITRQAFLVNANDAGANFWLSALTGFIRCISLEYKNVHTKLVDMDGGEKEALENTESFIEGLLSGNSNGIFALRKGNIYSQVFKKERFTKDVRNEVLFKENGVYIIAGGLGGIGLEIAKCIGKTVKAKVVLLGRRQLPERAKWDFVTKKYDSDTVKKVNAIKNIEALGCEVSYISVDLGREEEVITAIESVRAAYGSINGVIHAAGVLKDGLIKNLSQEMYDYVTTSKIRGAWLLDQATERDNLDFFVLCSALGTFLGNVGQSCYSTANSFLDSFAQYRTLIKKKKTTVINWGVWSEVGMVADSVNKKLLEEKGITPLTTEEAIGAFCSCLTADNLQFGIARLDEGVENKLLSLPVIGNESLEGRIPSAEKEAVLYGSESDLEDSVKKYLLKKINALKDSQNTVNYKTSFLEAGLDSMTMVNITDNFGKETGIKLYPTVLFEYPTIQELTKYLLKDYKKEIDTFFKDSLSVKEEAVNTVIKAAAIGLKEDREIIRSHKESESDSNRQYSDSDIAVIGMSGKFPGAKNVDEYWDNLLYGRNCVVEIPDERWDYREYYHTEKKKGKTYCKWGGFVEDIDLFDPLFFNISPMEATVLDPQQKHLLQAGWEALEDAGYADGSLFHTNTGVFVGVSNHNYFDESFDADNNYSGLGTANAIVANRLSYFLDFKGPSMSIDTQCSSSLVAVHEACKSILSGECKYALAAGVNFLIPKDYYILLSQMEAVSKDGSCKTFDKGANGFVSGEGIGVLLLKRLPDAIRDRDNIHCIIKASEVNHDGRSASLTAPNSKSQTELIKNCLKKASISPESITYVETHGTGTPIGDPIEIKGLTDAFLEYSSLKSYCALGAVKSNIGHLESAAGMAGMIKVIMAMKNQIIPGNIHFHEKNPLIDFADSPFYVLDKPTNWQAKDHPLRAGVSSFGMGGTNAHVILEQPPEYEEAEAVKVKGGYPVILSAKSEEALRVSVNRLLEYLKKGKGASLENVSYTLSTGRYHFSNRIAIAAGSIDELIAALQKVSANDLANLSSHPIFYSKVEGSDAISPLGLQDRRPIPVSVILPYYSKQALDCVIKTVNSGLIVNTVFCELLNEYKEILLSMGINLNYYFEGNALMYSETETILCIYIFIICFCRWLQAAGFVINKLVSTNYDHVVRVVLSNRKTPQEGVSYILEHVSVQEAKPEEQDISIFREEIYSGYLVNLNTGFEQIITDQEGYDEIIFSICREEDYGIDGLIQMLSSLYVKGEAVQFKVLYSHSARKISLPAYGFQLKSYWHNKKNQRKPEETDIKAGNQVEEKSKAADFFYKWYWQEVSPNEALGLEEGAVWILFTASVYLTDLIKKSLEDRKQRVVLVFKDLNFHKRNRNEYYMNPSKQEDYMAIFREVIADYQRVDSVINLWNYEQESLGTYYDSTLELLGMALGLLKIPSKDKEINLLTITDNGLMAEGINKQPFHISSYPVHLLSRLISSETKNIAARSIDLDSNRLSGEILEKLLFEYSLTRNGYSELAFRSKKAFIRKLKKEVLEYTHPKGSVWVEGGIYVITGGASGIGTEIGIHIAKAVKATIILIGRTELPVPSEFETFLKNGMDSQRMAKIDNILKIKKAGADVIYYSADITNEESTLRTFENIFAVYGGFTGIFHCAGSKKDSVITAKSFSDFKEVISIKVSGLSHIRTAVGNNPVDFIMAFSSIAALYGTPGQSDYSAANALMDAFVSDWACTAKSFVTSVNWTLWEGAGMDIPSLAKRKMAGDGLRAITITEGLHALEIILKHRKQANYIVMDLIKTEEFLKDLEKNKDRTPMSHKNGMIPSTSKQVTQNTVADRAVLVKETKEFLTRMLAKLLYLDALELDARRSLDEYGMDSLSIKEALTALEQHYDAVLEPSLFEEYPSIETLAEYLSTRFEKNLLQESEKMVMNHPVIEVKNELQESISTQYLDTVEDDGVENSHSNDELEELFKKLYEGEIDTSYAKNRILQLF